MTAKNIVSDRKRSRPVTKRKKTDFFKRNKIASLLIILIILMAAVAGIYVVTTGDKEKEDVTDEGNPIAVIDTSMGIIKVELYKDKVPNTCENFINLIEDEFFDGLVFHRVANIIPTPDTHVIQGGGFYPDGTFKESPFGSIDLEINDEVSHVDGAIAMARGNDPDSASSQFYICDGEHHELDDSSVQAQTGNRGYAVFGKVIEGMDVVREIGQVETGTKTIPAGQTMENWPVDDVIINSIRIENS